MTTSELQRDHLAIEVSPDRIKIKGEIIDSGLADYLSRTAASERAGVFTTFVRMGHVALASSRIEIDVDHVRREFDRFRGDVARQNQLAAETLAATLRTFFSEDGQVPATLEQFLGDNGRMRRLVDELFDEGRRDSAIGRFQRILGEFFDGDRSVLANLLDPTRAGSPLNQFKVDMELGFRQVHERLAALDAGKRARAEERAASTGKGFDFEDFLEPILKVQFDGSDALLERTSATVGVIPNCLKGDFTVTMRPGSTHEHRIVIEVKASWPGWPRLRREIEEAKRNRDAVLAVVVLSADAAPVGIDLLEVIGNDVYVVVEPADDQPSALEAATRLARILAGADGGEGLSPRIDVDVVKTMLGGVRLELDRIRALKRQLGSIGTVSTTVSRQLDDLRTNILARLADAEDELTPSSPESAVGTAAEPKTA